MSDSDEELDIGRRDFSKVIEIHAKEGYKEGISDGRDTEFQSGFDMGFTDGLRAGFTIGQQIALKELDPSLPLTVPKLPCQLCTSGLDQAITLPEISSIHRDSTTILADQVSHLVPNK